MSCLFLNIEETFYQNISTSQLLENLPHFRKIHMKITITNSADSTPIGRGEDFRNGNLRRFGRVLREMICMLFLQRLCTKFKDV